MMDEFCLLYSERGTSILILVEIWLSFRHRKGFVIVLALLHWHKMNNLVRASEYEY